MPRPLLLTLLLLAPTTPAITPEEAHRQTEDARRALGVADGNLARARNTTLRAQRDLDVVNARLVEIPRLIDLAQRARVDAEEHLTSAEKLLPALRAQSDQAKRDAAVAQSAATAALKNLEAAQSAAAAAKADLWK